MFGYQINGFALILVVVIGIVVIYMMYETDKLQKALRHPQVEPTPPTQTIKYNISHIMPDNHYERLVAFSGVTVRCLDNAFSHLYQHGCLDNYRGNKRAKQFVHGLNERLLHTMSVLVIETRVNAQHYLTRTELEWLLSMLLHLKKVEPAKKVAPPEKDRVLTRLQRVEKLEDE